MELVYPAVLYIGLIIIVLLIILKPKKTIKYDNGRKIANTKYIEEIPYYKEIMKKYKIISYSIKTICIIAILMSLILISRPASVNTQDSEMYNRDIYLCMDVSTSVDELNEQLVESLKKTVKSLKGERFGITIFNTSSVVLVPLTDDYEYVISVLDNLHKAFKSVNSLQVGNDYSYLTDYLVSGTSVGNEQRGSSLIGDGLASCVYNFSNLEEDRTRVIIFSTDNDLAGTELISLQDAAKLSKSKNITVFGIAPSTTARKNGEELKKAVESTGGNYYTDTGAGTVSKIVNEIEKKGKSILKGQKEVKRTDKPQIPFIILVISIMILFILNKKVKL